MHQADELTTPPKEKREAGGWKVPLPSTGYRRPLIGGPETAVYSDFFRAGTTLARCRQPYAEIVLPGEGGILELTTYDEKGEPIVHQLIGGRHVAFIAPHVWHSCRWERDGELMVIYQKPAFLRKHLGGRMWSGVVIGEFVIVASKDALIWRLTSVCRGLCGEGQPAERKLISDLGHCLARRTLVSNFGETAKQTKRPVMTPEQQRIVFDHLDAQIKRVPSNAELARLIGLSVLHFSRLFKNTTGMPPKRYQNTCRLRKAEQLVMSGKYRIKEIARDLGFSSMSYFDRVFHQFFGAPPRLYYEQKKCNIKPR